jgi:cysteine desulfurase / selenocysteine lyase
MSIDNLTFETPPDLINPTLIAQIASRIYNEIPGASNVPKTEEAVTNTFPSADLVTPPQGRSFETVRHPETVAPNIPVQDDPLDLTGIHNLWEHEGGIPTGYQGLGLEAVPKQPVAPGSSAEAIPSDYYFLKGTTAPREAPLSSHTDNLVSQQNFAGNNDSSHSLGQFVQKAQSVSGGFSDNKETVPFYQTLGNGFPSDHFDFSFLFGNAPSHLKPPVSVPDTASQHYFLRQQPQPSFAKTDIFDVNQVRKDFPVLHQNVHGHPLVWFDNAATTQKPQCVIDAISRFYSTDNSNIHRGAHILAARATDAYEGSRENVRRFLGANSTSEIIFVRGTTEGINLVAQTWGRKNIQPGDEILVSLLEHHANIVPWQMLAKEKGAVLRAIPVNDNGEILLDEYTRMLNPRTRLLAVTQASNGLGTILPVKEMIQLAKRYDITVLVDGAQSVAHLPVNVQELGADFYVFSGHKIFSPTGIGVVYGRKEILENMPPWQGGGNMIKNVTLEETTFNGLPNKFEAGTPNVADAIGLGAALDYVNRIGLKNIAEYEHRLTQYGTVQLQQVPGLRLIGTAREKVGVLSFVLAGATIEQVGKYLDQQGIAVRAGHHCTQPALRRFGVAGTVRPSLAFYNTFEEIDRLVDALKRFKYSNF